MKKMWQWCCVRDSKKITIKMDTLGVRVLGKTDAWIPAFCRFFMIVNSKHISPSVVAFSSI